MNLLFALVLTFANGDLEISQPITLERCKAERVAHLADKKLRRQGLKAAECIRAKFA
jgi:hypothetical protein